MAFTGVLGDLKAALGQLVLGSLGSGTDPALEPSVISTLTLVQGVTVEKTLNVSASNTLTLSQSATRIRPLVPIVGYSGGQARKVYVKDVTGNQELYALDEDDQSNFPASTTKLMTALIILQKKGSSLSDPVTLTTADVTAPYGGPSSAGFVNGDTTTYEGLLYAIFLPSSFEACQCAARLIGTEIYVANGSTGTTGMTRFVEEMNNQALALGMGNSNFVEVSGRSQTSSVQYNVMSAKDCAAVCAEVFTYTAARDIAVTPEFTLSVGGPSARDLTLTNYNRFVNGPTLNQQGIADENVIGGKNGTWTADGDHYNLAIMWLAPSGNEVVITVYHAESLLALTWDVQGIIYSILRDFPYLSVIGVDPDPQFSTVKLLVGADGSLVDESFVGRALTSNSITVSDPVIESTGGALINAVTDYLEVTTDASDLEFGAGDGTVEVYFMGPGASFNSAAEQLFFSKGTPAGQHGYALNWYPPGYFQQFASTTGSGYGSVISFGVLTTAQSAIFFNGAPRHIAWVKEGSLVFMYLNGERGAVDLTAATIFNGTSKPALGYVSDSISAKGTYDEWRISTSLARYTDFKHTLSGRKFSRESTAEQSVNNFLSLSDSATCVKTINVTASNTLSLTQRANKVVDAEAENTLVLDQDATFEKFKTVAGSNTLALTHALAREVDYVRSINQPLVLTHLATKQMYFARPATNTLALSQSATCTVSKTASNTLVLSHLAEYVYSHGARNTITLTQSAAREITYARALFSNFIPFQTLTREMSYRRSVTNTLVLAQGATCHIVKAASNALVLSQSATCYVAKPAFSILTLTDSASCSHVANVRGLSALALVQTIGLTKARAVQATSILGFNQFARATKVLHAAASNTLALSQALVADYLDETASNTLALSQLATATRIITVGCGNTLALTSAVALSKTIVRSVGNTLVFKQTFEKRTGISSFPVVSIPSAQVTITKRKCMMVLQYDNQTITLPCPEFQDSEGSIIRLNVKRSMNGTRRVYKRDNPTSTLHYDLVMDRLKAIELRNFILANNSNPLRLTNFKGELWFVLLTNSPFSFVEDAYRNSTYGNRSSISLEFEGVRLN